jgi:hypothetical protein
MTCGALAIAALWSCGRAEHEAPVPPPITAAKPAESAPPQPAVPAKPAPEEAAVVPAPAATAQEKPPAEPASTPGTSLPGAIPPAPLPDTKASEKPPDALQWLHDSEARKADYKRRVDEAETAVVNTDAAAATWERNLLAFKNPFLARPVLAQDDAAAIASMDGAQRVAWADAKLAAARAARDDAKKTLEDLKANPPLN